MSAAPATRGRRIGDIVLELGFASEEDVAKATIEHEKTGQPLGQILVDLGTITRLELASALAEQWSDQSASIKLLPIPPPASPPRIAPEPHHDDDQYAARLQDAVAELAVRVGAGASQPTEEFDDRVTDLAERVEATVARTQRIEATLATLAESFEGVTGGVEEAFGALQSGMAGLALDLARIDTTVAELTAQLRRSLRQSTPRWRPGSKSSAPPSRHSPSALPPTRRPRAVWMRWPLASTASARTTRPASSGRHWPRSRSASRSSRDPRSPTRSRSRAGWALSLPASRTSSRPDEVVALHDSLVAFEQRLAVLAEDAGSTAALDEQAQSLTELRATVVELESRPVGDPGARRAARPDRDPVRGAAGGQAGRRPDRGPRRPPRGRRGRAREPSHRGRATRSANRRDGVARRRRRRPPRELQERVETSPRRSATSVRDSRPRRMRAPSGSTSSARASPPCAMRSPRSHNRSRPPTGSSRSPIASRN